MYKTSLQLQFKNPIFRNSMKSWEMHKFYSVLDDLCQGGINPTNEPEKWQDTKFIASYTSCTYKVTSSLLELLVTAQSLWQLDCQVAKFIHLWFWIATMAITLEAAIVFRLSFPCKPPELCLQEIIQFTGNLKEHEPNCQPSHSFCVNSTIKTP